MVAGRDKVPPDRGYLDKTDDEEELGLCGVVNECITRSSILSEPQTLGLPGLDPALVDPSLCVEKVPPDKELWLVEVLVEAVENTQQPQ